MAGLEIPGIRPSFIRAAPIAAPLLPALTKASALLSRTISAATKREASFLLRKAAAGCSFISIHWEATARFTPAGSFSRRNSGPTRVISYFFAACATPATIWSGA